jgi:ABC-2 type transport system permease protein
MSSAVVALPFARVTGAARLGSLFRLELADALRSRWLAFAVLAYAAVFGAFTWLGLRESSVLGFTGLSRVVLNASNAIVIVLPLVALIATCQAVVKARTSGHFELFLSQPCRRREWFLALCLSRAVVLIGPLAFALLALLGVSAFLEEGALLPMVVNCFAITCALVGSFIGLGMLVSALSPTAERAVVLALLVWLFVSALHDFAIIGVLMEWRLQPEVVFALTAINPTEAARLALLSGVDPELSVLGPVGFWLANTLGPRWTLWFGMLWPLTLGVSASALALYKLERTDLVG